MEYDVPPHIIGLDRLKDGLYLYFNDGSKGFYSDVLLHSLSDRAEHSGDDKLLPEHPFTR
jgi:hypothetical protein